MRARITLACLLMLAGCATQTSTTPSPTTPWPAPTGKYAVGTRILEPQVDASRPDSRLPGGARTMLVQLWYPAATRSGERSLYIAEEALIDSIKAESSAPDVIEGWRRLRTNAVANAAVAGGKFPLLFFSPGFGMPRAFYTSWVEELASQGYIVAAVDHPFAGRMSLDGKIFDAAPNPDGPAGQTAAMAADLSFLLPRLLKEPGVDATRIAAAGHSIGGGAALEACRTDKRFTACVNLDGDPSFGRFAETGVGSPFLVVHQQPVYADAKPGGELARIGRELETEWQGIIAKQSAPVTRLSVRGTAHLSFTDLPFTRPSVVAEGAGELSDPTLILRATTKAIAAFLANSFAGHPERPVADPPLITPAKLGS